MIPSPRASIDIIRSCAQAFNVPEQVVLSRCNMPAFAYPRFAAMKLIRDERALSLPIIARLMCRKDHTTILSGIRRAEHLIANDPGFADAYERARVG